VAGVARRKEKYPEVIDPILTAIDGVSLRCKNAFLDLQNGTKDATSLITELEVRKEDGTALVYLYRLYPTRNLLISTIVYCTPLA
jgi:mevalonate kinase